MVMKCCCDFVSLIRAQMPIIRFFVIVAIQIVIAVLVFTMNTASWATSNYSDSGIWSVCLNMSLLLSFNSTAEVARTYAVKELVCDWYPPESIPGSLVTSRHLMIHSMMAVSVVLLLLAACPMAWIDLPFAYKPDVRGSDLPPCKCSRHRSLPSSMSTLKAAPNSRSRSSLSLPFNIKVKQQLSDEEDNRESGDEFNDRPLTIPSFVMRKVVLAVLLTIQMGLILALAVIASNYFHDEGSEFGWRYMKYASTLNERLEAITVLENGPGVTRIWVTYAFCAAQSVVLLIDIACSPPINGKLRSLVKRK